jgi:hypothetical protein
MRHSGAIAEAYKISTANELGVSQAKQVLKNLINSY